MKRFISHFKNWFMGHSLRAKLTVTFSSVMVLLLLLLMVLLNRFITGNYRQQLLESTEKSCEQAYAFLQNYLDTMVNVSNQIYYNTDLQKTMTSEEFNADRSIGVQYREFLRLDKVFSTAEMVDVIYRARVFIPDEIFYSYNRKHFAGYSDLLEHPEFEGISEKLQWGAVYFSTPREEEIPGLFYTVNLFSMFRVIRTTDGAARPVTVEEISVQTKMLQEVLSKSDITQSGLIYLVDGNGNIVSSSVGSLTRIADWEKKGTLPEISEGGPAWTSQRLENEEYLMRQQRLELPGWTLVTLVPEEEITRQTAPVSSVILSLSLVAVALAFLAAVLIARSYTRRLEQLDRMMNSVQKGNLDVPVERPEGDEIGRLFQSFSRMTQELKELMDRQYFSGQEVKAAHLKALRAQINPHFLYNTLDLINWEAIDHDLPQVAEIAQNLAKFYRISLNKGDQIVTVREELSHVEAYVKIENYHFDGAITLKTRVPEELLSLGCPNIILQPLVENAIMHGMAENLEIDHCTISITGSREGDMLVLKVSDDGPGMSEEQLRGLNSTDPTESHGYGLKNIDSRLKLSFGEQCGLDFQSVLGKGTTVFVRFPALPFEKMQEQIK